MNKPTVYLLQGIPGSGKSSWAKAKAAKDLNTLIVCRDTIRYMIKGGLYTFNKDFEPSIAEIAEASLQIFLERGFNVIVDETNLKGLWRYNLKQIIGDKARIVYVVFTENKNNLENRMRDGRGYDAEYWSRVIEEMKKNTDPIGADEGYEKIIYISNPFDLTTLLE